MVRRPDATREGGTKVSDHWESRFSVAWMGTDVEQWRQRLWTRGLRSELLKKERKRGEAKKED